MLIGAAAALPAFIASYTPALNTLDIVVGCLLATTVFTVALLRRNALSLYGEVIVLILAGPSYRAG